MRQPGRTFGGHASSRQCGWNGTALAHFFAPAMNYWRIKMTSLSLRIRAKASRNDGKFFIAAVLPAARRMSNLGLEAGPAAEGLPCGGRWSCLEMLPAPLGAPGEPPHRAPKPNLIDLSTGQTYSAARLLIAALVSLP